MSLLRLRTDQVSWREFPQEIIGLDLRTGQYFRVNSQARGLWHALQEGTTREDMVRLLIDEFDIGESTATADVAEFLDELERSQLLEAAPDASV